MPEKTHHSFITNRLDEPVQGTSNRPAFTAEQSGRLDALVRVRFNGSRTKSGLESIASEVRNAAIAPANLIKGVTSAWLESAAKPEACCQSVSNCDAAAIYGGYIRLVDRMAVAGIITAPAALLLLPLYFTMPEDAGAFACIAWLYPPCAVLGCLGAVALFRMKKLMENVRVELVRRFMTLAADYASATESGVQAGPPTGHYP